MIKTGPHMYSDECECESCLKARAPIGNAVDVEAVRKEATLMQEQCGYKYRHNVYHKIEDPVMRVPCDMILRLCELADEAAYWRKLYLEMRKPMRPVVSFSTDTKGEFSNSVPAEYNCTVSGAACSGCIRNINRSKD